MVKKRHHCFKRCAKRHASEINVVTLSADRVRPMICMDYRAGYKKFKTSKAINCIAVQWKQVSIVGSVPGREMARDFLQSRSSESKCCDRVSAVSVLAYTTRIMVVCVTDPLRHLLMIIRPICQWCRICT